MQFVARKRGNIANCSPGSRANTHLAFKHQFATNRLTKYENIGFNVPDGQIIGFYQVSHVRRPFLYVCSSKIQMAYIRYKFTIIISFLSTMISVYLTIVDW